MEKVGRVGRFYDGMERAEVRFLEEHNPRIAAREVCEVTVHGLEKNVEQPGEDNVADGLEEISGEAQPEEPFMASQLGSGRGCVVSHHQGRHVHLAEESARRNHGHFLA